MGLFGKKNQTDDKKVASSVGLQPRDDKKSTEPKVAKKEVTEEVKSKPVKAVKKAAKKVVAKKEGFKSKSGSAYRVLIKPIISEKATIGAAQNKYAFEIASDSNKVEVKKAVFEIYGVLPESVNILNQRGKSVRFGRRFGSTKSIKKAVVTLKKGDSIKLYEGI